MPRLVLFVGTLFIATMTVGCNEAGNSEPSPTATYSANCAAIAGATNVNGSCVYPK